MRDGGPIKISIVTNAFNQGQYLASALSSVLTQNWPEVEYIVVDPGSTDETAEIIQKFQGEYPGRIIHISEPDNGPADGLNKAFERATGDLFGYLNADDLYLPGCFKAVVGAAERNQKPRQFTQMDTKRMRRENLFDEWCQPVSARRGLFTVECSCCNSPLFTGPTRFGCRRL